jgi:hypothetical protein
MALAKPGATPKTMQMCDKNLELTRRDIHGIIDREGAKQT